MGDEIPIPHDGALRKKITRCSVSMLVLGCSLTVAIFVIVMTTNLPEWTEQVKLDMSEEETSSLRQLAANKAAFATEVFSRISTDTVLLTEFANSALARADDGSTLVPSPGIPAQGWQLTEDYAQQPDGAQFSWEHSVYYLPGRAGVEHIFDNLPGHTKALLNKITGLDMAFRTLQEQYGQSGTLLYIGLEDPDTGDPTAQVDPAEQSAYIVFPGSDMCSYSTWPNKCKDGNGDFVCVANAAECTAGNHQWVSSTTKRCDQRWTGAPASWSRFSDGVLPEYYDPRCRGWYQDARQARQLIFTSPYTDANTGKLVMTAAVPLYHDPIQRTQFAGVVAIDFSIADLQRSILGQRILDDGYAYIMAATDGGAVIHKDLDEGKPPVSVASLEGINPGTDFVEKMRNGCVGIAEYERDAYEGTTAYEGVAREEIVEGPWLMSYAPETAVGLAGCSGNIGHGFGYSIGLTVSVAALQQPFEELEDDLKILIVLVLVIMVAFICLGQCVMSWIAQKIGKGTVKPIRNLLKLTMKINQRSEFVTTETISDMMGEQAQDSAELELLVNTYKQMVTVVQAANFQLSAGEYSKALKSYEEALELFNGMKNSRGIGRCSNNIAVAYMEMANESLQAGDADWQSKYSQYIGLAKMNIDSAIRVQRKEITEGTTRTSSTGGSMEAQTALVKTLAHYLHVKCTVYLAALTEGDTRRYTGLANENVDALIADATESLKHADAVSEDPLRKLDCRCMLAALRAAAKPQKSQEPIGQTKERWADADKFVETYVQRTHNDPPKCVLKQRLLVRTAADADARSDRAFADDLRAEALRTGPVCDLRSLLEAATELSRRPGKHQTFGTRALREMSSLANGSSAKAIHFVLDYSGSMAGSQITACITSIQSIFQDHINDIDHVSLTTFNSSVRPKISWMVKSGNESTIADGIGRCNKPGGGTAIWDALIHAVGESQLPPPGSGDLWVCLLTDGEDNRSNHTHAHAQEHVRSLTQRGALKGLITISAGGGVSSQTKEVLRSLANTSNSGLSIETGADPESIQKAFGEAAAAMDNELVLSY